MLVLRLIQSFLPSATLCPGKYPSLTSHIATKQHWSYPHRMLHNVPVRGHLRKPKCSFCKLLPRTVHYALAIRLEVTSTSTKISYSREQKQYSVFLPIPTSRAANGLHRASQCTVTDLLIAIPMLQHYTASCNSTFVPHNFAHPVDDH